MKIVLDNVAWDSVALCVDSAKQFANDYPERVGRQASALYIREGVTGAVEVYRTKTGTLICRVHNPLSFRARPLCPPV
jgi:hypothetical protein